MFDLKLCYAKINSSFGTRNYFDENLLENEKIIEKKNNKIIFKNNKVKEFYQNYEREINSFKREKLSKIYDDLNIMVEIIIKASDNIRKIVINVNKFEYIDYQNRNNDFCIKSSKSLWCNMSNGNKDKYLIQNNSLDIADISFIFNTNIIDKDEIGVYFVDNGNKEYLYLFNKEKNLYTFLVG